MTALRKNLGFIHSKKLILAFFAISLIFPIQSRATACFQGSDNKAILWQSFTFCLPEIRAAGKPNNTD